MIWYLWLKLQFNPFDNNIGPEGVKAIGASLSINSSLTSLYLSGDYIIWYYILNYYHNPIPFDNNIGSEGAKAIGALLSNNSSLTELDLRCDYNTWYDIYDKITIQSIWE